MFEFGDPCGVLEGYERFVCLCQDRIDVRLYKRKDGLEKERFHELNSTFWDCWALRTRTSFLESSSSA